MKKLIAVVVFLTVGVNSAQAGRPIETDDASVTAHRTCQLDFWTENALEVRQDNFNGGCNFAGNSEFSLGLGAAHGSQEDLSLKSLGYKHMLRDFTENSTGFGLAASREWGRLKFSDESSQETLLTTIASVPLHGTDLLLHLNLGYLQYSDQIQSDNSIFKAAALDYSFNERVGFSVETYSDVNDSLSWRIGARYTLIPDLLQVDTSYGSDYGTSREARAFTLGLGVTLGF